MKNKVFIFLGLFFILLLAGTQAFAHFGMIIPSDPMLMPEDNRNLVLSISFSHPFEMAGMDMVMPNSFKLFFRGKKTDMMADLKETKVMDHKAWSLSYQVKRPGVYIFVLEPAPYWEPAEDCFIIHYTKTVVAAFGDDEGWDQELGLKTEIVPLSKPFGLYAGNVFQGIVKLDGNPVPYAEVEIEYFNEEGTAMAPTDYMVTQSVKADGNGVFTYAAPKAGWWGFAALNTSSEQMEHKGTPKDIEIGAVLWVRFEEWVRK